MIHHLSTRRQREANVAARERGVRELGVGRHEVVEPVDEQLSHRDKLTPDARARGRRDDLEPDEQRAIVAMRS